MLNGGSPIIKTYLLAANGGCGGINKYKRKRKGREEGRNMGGVKREIDVLKKGGRDGNKCINSTRGVKSGNVFSSISWGFFVELQHDIN